MKTEAASIPDVLVVRPDVHEDGRGFFLESWNARVFAAAGIPAEFVQDNHSRSARGTLRGLHYQLRRPQGKLVRAVTGSVFDVAVDVRRSSSTFGRWVGTTLSEENRCMLWIPPGFAHGFLVLSETADFVYKCTEFYDQRDDRSIAWNDPDIAIRWPLGLGQEPILSARDRNAPRLSDAECY